jgi:hypothetical protein
MLHVILQGHWYDIIFLIVRTPSQDKIDDMGNSFYGQLERVFDKFPNTI